MRLWLRVSVVVALLVTLGLGLVLRLQLAGVPMGSLSFVHLRHAHAHLGYYGLLFPLVFVAWRHLGDRGASLRTLTLYGLAVVVATVGFAYGGYIPPAHAGSGVVLAVWLFAAWRLRTRLSFVRADWLATTPIVLVLGALALIPVAVLTQRGDPLALSFVQVFLTLLLFGVVVPSALGRLGAPPPPPLLWFAASLLTASFAGFGPSPWLGVGPFLAGALAARAVVMVRAELALDVVALWVLAALGAGAYGIGVLPYTHAVAIAAVHFLILGPVLVSLAAPVWRAVPLVLRLAWLTTLAAMCAAILASHPGAAALSGGALVVFALGAAPFIIRELVVEDRS